MVDALAVARDEVARLGLRAVEEWLGPVPVVRLVDAGGAEVAAGSGKRSLTGAYYEALEGCFLARLAHGSDTRIMTAAEVAGQPGIDGDRVVRRWAADYPDATAACVPMRGPTTLWYPAFLRDPAYRRAPVDGDTGLPYRTLLRYASSIGTAAGPDVQDATGRAVRELVEHDALSLAMLRWFVAGQPALDLLDPADAGPLLAVAGEAAGARVHLADITSDLGVPVYLAAKDGDGAVFGLGGTPEHALEELIQMTAAERPPSTLDGLRPWPRLVDCATLPLRRLAAGARTVGRRAEQVDVGQCLKSKGIESYRYVLTPEPYTLAVVTVVAPGLERFSLIYAGRPVVPTGRGWALWASATTPAR